MTSNIAISSALISVYDKKGLDPIIKTLRDLGVKIYSTGGTANHIKSLGVKTISVESVTDYPSILGGRVKTLHPKIFGGILNRHDNPQDQNQLNTFNIPDIDLVIVDLYPFEDTIARNAPEDEIIEKIDIGGISLIRAAAKNFKDVFCVSSVDDYSEFLNIISKNKGVTTLEQRKVFARKAFNVSSHYDTAIFNYFNQESDCLKISYSKSKPLRYGENPHQKAHFFGHLDKVFDQLHGKELSYNNLLDVNAAVNIIQEFKKEEPTFAILKHNNACGVASCETIFSAYQKALAGDSVSAFGGVLIANQPIDKVTAESLNKLFFEVIIAPNYETEALNILTKKKNRIILTQKLFNFTEKDLRSCLNGILLQNKDSMTDAIKKSEVVTKLMPTKQEVKDLEFASKICKHTKSNAIVLVKDKQLIGSGTGQTSRVDALKQAIDKARSFNFDLKGAVMSSDAFFPFPDCVLIASEVGITSIIQPGGSIKDNLSIDACNKADISMLFTNTRHFKH